MLVSALYTGFSLLSAMACTLHQRVQFIKRQQSLLNESAEADDSCMLVDLSVGRI